ncbi:ABC transporter substrate-binding protein [Cohnella cellulosilytica]|uniref:ABC transporter substrate-binding protein n=1 Tax=Cohnella cellulosilytica TaxID=986710 RepID=A0ABW2F484_9BACL
MRNNRGKIRKLKAGTGALVLAVTLTLTGCMAGGGKKPSAGGVGRDAQGSLKVAYFNEQAFYQQYGNAFQAMFPNVQLEVVPTDTVFSGDDPVAGMEKLLAEQHPDALMLTEEQYAALANKGLLYDLDAAIKQDEFDLDAFAPTVIDLLKARGGGKLYGLSPSFSSRALYYNKGLFDQHGIPYPTDGMSWEEAMQLAARFPVKKDGDDPLYGLFQPSQTTEAFELVRTIGEAKGLSYADADAGTVTIDSPEWREIIAAVVDGYKSGSISMPSSQDGGMGGGISLQGAGGGRTFRIGGDSMRFMSGQAAMAIDDSMLMMMMGIGSRTGGADVSVKAAAPAGKGGPIQFKDIDWDVVTLPTDPSQPDVADGMSLENVFAINASSENVPVAWELLKYANGEQLARTNAMSAASLSSRTAFKKQEEGKNLDAFYALGVNAQILLQNLPEGFEASFGKLASEQIVQAADGKATVDEAVQAIQTQGQQLLTKALAGEE